MAATEPVPEVNRKVALLGERGVGKTSLTTCFVDGKFQEQYDPTIEATYRKTIKFKRIHFKTEILDTAGMDEYPRPSRNATVGVNGYVLVYSIISRQSFDRLRTINEVLFHMLGDPPELPRILVGTMLDLEQNRVVSYDEGKALAAEWGIRFIECSAKGGVHVSDVFTTLIEEIEKDNPLMAQESTNSSCYLL